MSGSILEVRGSVRRLTFRSGASHQAETVASWKTRGAGESFRAGQRRTFPRDNRTERSCPMKLSTARVRLTLAQLEEQEAFADTVAIPEDNPVLPQLNELFGDHTFFLDSEGLHIVEPAPSDGGEAPAGQVVKLATWRDPSRSALTPHRPEPTEIVVMLGPEEED
jgi:hypothetical protein